MAKKKSTKPKTILLPYKDTPEVRQELLMMAAKQGHGKLMWVIREAVSEYLERHRGKKLAAG